MHKSCWQDHGTWRKKAVDSVNVDSSRAAKTEPKEPVPDGVLGLVGRGGDEEEGAASALASPPRAVALRSS